MTIRELNELCQRNGDIIEITKVVPSDGVVEIRIC